jgi:hypothetical protein
VHSIYYRNPRCIQLVARWLSAADIDSPQGARMDALWTDRAI